MRKSSADGPASALRRSKRCLPKRSSDNEGALSAPLVCPVTRGNVDPIQVAISFGFAEDRAMLALEVDPGDGEPKFFEVTAERDGDRIADRDPGWQADVVIGPTGAGHGRVGMWRGGVRSTMSVAAPFVWRCLSGSAMTPFPHPAHRTQQADFPHCALGQDLTPSPTTGRAHAGSDVRARSARRGARVDTSRLGVA